MPAMLARALICLLILEASDTGRGSDLGGARPTDALDRLVEESERARELRHLGELILRMEATNDPAVVETVERALAEYRRKYDGVPLGDSDLPGITAPPPRPAIVPRGWGTPSLGRPEQSLFGRDTAKDGAESPEPTERPAIRGDHPWRFRWTPDVVTVPPLPFLRRSVRTASVAERCLLTLGRSAGAGLLPLKPLVARVPQFHGHRWRHRHRDVDASRVECPLFRQAAGR
jgi:hypothetical protein